MEGWKYHHTRPEKGQVSPQTPSFLQSCNYPTGLDPVSSSNHKNACPGPFWSWWSKHRFLSLDGVHLLWTPHGSWTPWQWWFYDGANGGLAPQFRVKPPSFKLNAPSPNPTPFGAPQKWQNTGAESLQFDKSKTTTALWDLLINPSTYNSLKYSNNNIKIIYQPSKKNTNRKTWLNQ